MNMAGAMLQSIGECKAKKSLILDALDMALVYGGQNVFYVDQSAKAFLLICKVLLHDEILNLAQFIDPTIFEPDLTFTKLTDYGREVSSIDDGSHFTASPKKRA